MGHRVVLNQLLQRLLRSFLGACERLGVKKPITIQNEIFTEALDILEDSVAAARQAA